MLFNRYDFVSVRDGGTSDSPLVGRYCGSSTVPPSYLSTGNQIIVRFKSDHSVSHDGFRVSYRTGKLDFSIDIIQDEICHATSKSFHGSSVQTKDVMSEKNCLKLPHR